MEVLNKNQRRSAMWRVVAISVFILALIATGMLAMHQSYTGQGYDEISELKKKHEQDLRDSKLEIRDLNNKITELNKKLNNNSDSEKYQETIDDLKHDKKMLNRKLDLAKSDLSKCRSNQNGY